MKECSHQSSGRLEIDMKSIQINKLKLTVSKFATVFVTAVCHMAYPHGQSAQSPEEI